MKKQIHFSSQIFLLFIATRIILFVSVPYEVIPGYGDYWNFFSQAKLGVPFIEFWTEFPPLFPFLSKIIYELVGGIESRYGYAVAITISLFQAGSLALVFRLAQDIYNKKNGTERIWIYFVLTVGLFYTWSYFDPIAVFFALLGIYWLISGEDHLAALAIGLGVLTKWFPLLVLPAIWKMQDRRKALIITSIVLAIVIMVWGGLYFLNPEFTLASLSSQVNKGSWESIWALIDNNLTTGNFSSQINRLDPATVSLSTGNPAIIPTWITLILFGGLGLFFLIKANLDSTKKLISFIGLTQIIFFLWSPGYSPQWVLFLLPFMFICLDKNEAYLMSTIFILINLLEWPLLLSRGNFGSLFYLIPLRTIMMIFLGLRFYLISLDHYKVQQG